jgi:hypothetical protein
MSKCRCRTSVSTATLHFRGVPNQDLRLNDTVSDSLSQESNLYKNVNRTVLAIYHLYASMRSVLQLIHETYSQNAAKHCNRNKDT